MSFRLFLEIESVKQFKPEILIIGNFDGVHLGHQKLLSVAKTFSKKILIITFEPHPRNFFQPNSVEFLNTKKQKYKLLHKYGAKGIWEIKFNESFANLLPEKFCNLLISLNPKHIIIGQGFKFGKNQSGNEFFLEKYLKPHNTNLHIINPVSINNIPVSSSKIRSYIKDGKIKQANNMLGYNFTLSGIVKNGLKIGRTLGYPTANLSTNQIIPKLGVYSAQTNIDDKNYKVALSIGNRDTLYLNSNKNFAIEAHIIDFKGDLYNQVINIEMLSFIRNQIKFDSIEHLKIQIDKDIKRISTL